VRWRTEAKELGAVST